MLLTFKLIATPVIIAVVTLVGRRWGTGVSGWLVGLPLTSGPISVFLALQYGQPFAAQAAVGALGGIASVAFFSLAYCLIAPHANWFISIGAALAAFLLATAIWNQFSLSLLPTFILITLIILVIARILPDARSAPPAASGPQWDIPMRMATATVFLLLITTFANSLGPQLSGLLTPFPIFSTVLVIFTHRQQGPQAGIQFLRGVVTGSLGYVAFFVVVGACLTSLGMVWTYTLATIAALSVNAFSLSRVR